MKRSTDRTDKTVANHSVSSVAFLSVPSVVSGFTLVELLVVVILFVLISGALLTSFLIGRTSYFSADTNALVQQESRRAFDNMVRELRESGNVSETIVGTVDGTTQLNFQIALGYNQAGCPNAICWGNDDGVGANNYVHYSIIGASGNTRQLIRCNNTDPAGAITVLGAGCRVLANYVRHINGTTPDAFDWSLGNKTVKINLEIEYANPLIPEGAQNTGNLTTVVKLRNP
jgi:type II secretory pathway pseudopilin PulG